MNWEPPVPPNWNDTNRAFLQALMARGSLTLEEARPIVAAILNGIPNDNGQDAVPIEPDTVQTAEIEHFVAMAREAVSALEYDIRKLRHQTTDEEVWAFVNTQSDPVTQLATSYSPDELAFIKRLLDAMFDTHNQPRMELMCVTEDQALKLSRPPPRSRESNGVGVSASSTSSPAPTQAAERALRHSEVLVLLATLVEEDWLEKSAQGFYSLAPRALMELWPWLMESYNDPDAEAGEWERIKHCEACKDIVTVGQRCPRMDCHIRLHDICEESYFRSRRSRLCPKCKTAWTGGNYVGERAVTETAAYQRSRARGGVGRRSGVVQSIIEEAHGEEEEEDMRDDDGGSSNEA